MKHFAVFLVCSLALTAADKKIPELPAKVKPLVDLARESSPELLASVLARLVEAGAIPLREQQVELLREAFASAARAAEPMRLVAIPATPPDTRAMFRSKAGELQWDVLSLQSRIAKDLLPIDRAAARELFDHILRPTLAPRPCEDPLIADVSAYYEAAAAVAQTGFSAPEKEQELHVQFLTTVLSGARSPMELAAFARVAQPLELTRPQRELLSAALAAKLQSIGPDYRSFAMSYAQLQAAEPDAPLAAYAHTQLSAQRCSPDLAIGFDEPHTIRPGATFTADPYFQSADDKQIGDALTRLRALAGSPSTEAADWRNQLADFLRDLSAWTPQGSAIDAFHQRATVLRALLEFVPHGDDRDRILNLSVMLLQSSGADRQNPAEWLYQVTMLAGGARSDAPRMMEALRASGNPGLTLYALFDGKF